MWIEKIKPTTSCRTIAKTYLDPDSTSGFSTNIRKKRYFSAFFLCYTLFMKKIYLVIIILVVVALGVYYIKSNKNPIDDSIKTYRNSNVGLTFVYPKILFASTTSDTVRIHHEVPFDHHDFCDFKGENNTTIPTLTDFNVTFHISEASLIETMKTESPYLPNESFVNDEVVVSPGFIDTYEVGTLKGYRIFEGAEGCGKTTYYFPISKSKTLVVQQDLITIFTGAIDTANKERAEAVPGVLNKERAEQVFESILKTLIVQ